MMKRPLIIGITGSIASGKSQVVKVLQEAAYKVYSTDELGHQVLQMDQVKDKLVSKFGKEILSGDKTIDRSKLGELVFVDKANLDYLNSLSHPQIFTLMNKIISQSGEKYIFFEVPLLFEANLSESFDFIITVSASEENQVLRKKLQHREPQKDLTWQALECSNRGKIIIYNGSPRGKKGNSLILIKHLICIITNGIFIRQIQTSGPVKTNI